MLFANFSRFVPSFEVLLTNKQTKKVQGVLDIRCFDICKVGKVSFMAVRKKRLFMPIRLFDL